MFLCLKSVIPAKAGIQKPALEGLNRGSLILKELDSRLRTPAYDMRGQASGMTFLDFCKSLRLNMDFIEMVKQVAKKEVLTVVRYTSKIEV